MEKKIDLQTPIRDTIKAGDTEIIEMGQHVVKRQISIKDGATLKLLDESNLILEE